MALNQTNKLVWIVETIYRAHKISFEELNRRWMDNVDLSGGEEMLKRTFQFAEVEYLRHLRIVDRLRKDRSI